MHPLLDSRWFVAKMIRSAIHQADMAREATIIRRTTTIIMIMKKKLPACTCVCWDGSELKTSEGVLAMSS